MEVKEKKQLPRFRRQGTERPSLILQTRDLEIINTIYEYRFLNSEMLIILFSASYRGLLRRLQKLYHHGYLDRLKGSLSQPIVYALGNRGADVLVETYGIDRGRIDWRKKNQEVKEFYLGHTLQIANFRANLTLALKDKSETKILFWLPIGELKKEIIFQEGGRKQRIPIVPDGFFCLQDQDDLMFFFLEADRSTMTNERFFNKMRGYFQFWKYMDSQKHKLGYSPFQIEDYQIEAFRVLTITKSEARKENLRRITKEADDRQTGFEGFWFASETNYNLKSPETILKPIWQTPKNDSYHYLLE